VQLAWAVFDTHGRKTGERTYLIRPDGFEIPKKAVRIHGISTGKAKLTGVPVIEALGTFAKVLNKVSVVVTHNLSFDANVVGAELHRLGIKHQFRGKAHVCTKEVGTEFCAIPGPYGYKWPTLAELHFRLFRKSFKDAHDAATDVATCYRCFFELKRLGIIRVTKRVRR
jgi:DNA polymerase-3 subunit epsilon